MLSPQVKKNLDCLTVAQTCQLTITIVAEMDCPSPSRPPPDGEAGLSRRR